jgi:hypothetical protein
MMEIHEETRGGLTKKVAGTAVKKKIHYSGAKKRVFYLVKESDHE